MVPGWTHRFSGKVRDVYAPEQPHPAGDVLLLVASDRVSAYDHVLPTPVPGKGAVLTALSLWWFAQLEDLVDNHLTGAPVPDVVADRAVVVRALDMVPVECVARGYLSGSGTVEYRQGGSVCGVPLPPGLARGLAAARAGVHPRHQGGRRRARRERRLRPGGGRRGPGHRRGAAPH